MAPTYGFTVTGTTTSRHYPKPTIWVMESSDPFRIAKAIARWGLGGFLLAAGSAHLGSSRAEFLAQVPDWLPLNADFVVVASGVVEIALGAALIALPRQRATVGLLTALFFVAIFPGNVAQYVEGTDAFGLDTDRERLVRLFFQPVLVALAL